MDFGSLVCKPINPKCAGCDFNKLCKYTFSTTKIKKVIKSVNKVCIIFKYGNNYLVFKNNYGLFIGLYAIDLLDKNEVELFIKSKIRSKNILSSKKINTINITISNKKMTIDLIVIEIYKTDDLENFRMISKKSLLEKIYQYLFL